jgi:hypothetical protein
MVNAHTVFIFPVIFADAIVHLSHSLGLAIANRIVQAHQARS